MKSVLITLAVLFCFGTSHAQLTWSSGIPANPDYLNNYVPMENVMYNNDVYEVYDSGVNDLKVARYNSQTGQWSIVQTVNNPGTNVRYRSAIIGDNWFIVVAGLSDTKVYKFNFTAQTLNLCPGTLPWVPDACWVSKNNPGGNEFSLAYTVNSTDVYLSIFDATTETFSGSDYTSLLNSAGADLSSSGVELYLSTNDVYVGVSGAVNRLLKAALTNISSPTYYNSAGTNDGYFRLNGSNLINGFYYLTGDGQSEPYITVQNATNYEGYESQLTDADININTSTTTPNTFYTWQNDHESLEHAAYAFLASPFSTVNNGSNYDKFYVYRKDNGTNNWDSLGPKIEYGIYDVTPNTLRLSLENSHQQHLLTGYASTDGEFYFKVLNNKPSVITASQSISSGMCGGHNNLIYPQLEIEDADNDYIRILSVTSTNGNVQNAYAVAIGTDNSSSPGWSKFAIYGFVQTQGNTQIIVTYTDGWNVFTDTLNSITIVGTAPNIVFDSSISHLCSNENMISLSDYVNYVDQGVFSINGQIIPNGIINGIEYYNSQPSGSLDYKINVDGCIVETGASYNFVLAGTASATTTNATCGGSNGSATATYTAGTSTNFTVEWSTGEITPTINNLNPGAYYYQVTDDNGCHATGFAGVGTVSITATETITNVSCYGLSDGELSIVVSGPTNYQTIWSNGYSTPTIQNLSAGTYWVTIYDLDGDCQVTYNYTVTQPAQLHAAFAELEPACGLTNGAIYGTYSGGAGGYTYNWLNQGQTLPDLNNVGYGFYEVEVTDVNGCIDTFGHQLDNFQALDIKETISSATCNLSNGAVFVNLQADPNGGTTVPLSINWSNGAIGNSNGNLSSGSYTVDVVNTISIIPFTECHAMKTFFVPIKAPIIQPICLVTVDTLTTTNLVVWAPSDYYGIDHYKIYRENSAAGEYSLIDTVDYDNLSVFNDVVASPEHRSWRYRISQVNECGIESPISPAHKTLHLTTFDVQADESVDIFWDDYEGNINAANYHVWRHTDQNDWEDVGTVPVGTTIYNDLPPTGITGLDYYIEMVLQTPCTAEKAQDFNTTRSNKDKGAFKVGEGTGNSNNELGENSFSYQLYPNPFTSNLVVDITQNGIGQDLLVFNTNGQLLKTIRIESAHEVIDLSSLSQGLYYIRIEGSPNNLSIVKN